VVLQVGSGVAFDSAFQVWPGGQGREWRVFLQLWYACRVLLAGVVLQRVPFRRVQGLCACCLSRHTAGSTLLQQLWSAVGSSPTMWQSRLPKLASTSAVHLPAKRHSSHTFLMSRFLEAKTA